MEGIAFASRRLLMIVLAIMFLIVLASVLMTSVMGNNILIPVQEMKDSAAAISKGDFSREVQVSANDEIGQLSQAFNQMTRDLSQVETLQKDFIANISHDFRSPLTSIKGYVEAMLDGTIPQDSYDKYLQIVLDEANRLTKMTNNVLDLTKMENGQIELNRRSFDINELIVGLALSFEQRVEDKKIQIQFQFIQEKLFVYADFDQIQRVIYNLLDNALKFTDEGDSITVETSIIGKKAHISVEDTGCGIEENALPHVFDRFNKGDKSRGKNKLGTGLGLAIAKQIIVNHGEDISVASHLGEGTKFSFTLPLGTDQRSGKDTGK
jgi:signal transduction histidine kinase